MQLELGVPNNGDTTLNSLKEISWEMACTLAPLLVNEDPFWKMWCPTGLEDWGCTDGYERNMQREY